MSRLVHRNIQDAFSKAGLAQKFNKAHEQAGLSQNVRHNKWHERWWRWITKFFGGDYDQKLNQTAFGQGIHAESSAIKRKAMKVQKIYGFIRFITRLLAPTTLGPSSSGEMISYYEFLDTIEIIILSKKVLMTIEKGGYCIKFDWNDEIDVAEDPIPPFSKITNADEIILDEEDTNIIDKVYNNIIWLSRKFNPSGQQSMSRLAHRNIRDAYIRAGLAQKFNEAHEQAGLSQNVRHNEWYERWWRAFIKLFGGHDQTINNAFGKRIHAESSTIKRRAMKVQKIYGFIRLITTLLHPTNFDAIGLYYDIPIAVITVYPNNIQITRKSDFNHKIAYAWRDRIDPKTDRIPPFSRISNARDYLTSEKSATVNDIYRDIIEYSKKFDPPGRRQMTS